LPLAGVIGVKLQMSNLICNEILWKLLQLYFQQFYKSTYAPCLSFLTSSLADRISSFLVCPTRHKDVTEYHSIAV
jgi:hypothetical protein